MYLKFWKRFLDIVLSALALIVLSPLLLALAVLVRVKLGSPVIFCQERPGKIDPKTGQEKIFKLYKFRSMTDERDENGELLPDEVRLTPFGKKLRATSLDELPELQNILEGDMSIVGPRPQLVRDMVFMTPEQRERHTVRPGLTGLAQVNGRNAARWEDKLKWDIKYIESISFLNDVKIVLQTFVKVFGRSETDAELDLTLDYGDALLSEGKVTKADYDILQAQAKELIMQTR